MSRNVAAEARATLAAIIAALREPDTMHLMTDTGETVLVLTREQTLRLAWAMETGEEREA